MFADDTQLFNKDEHSVKNLSIYFQNMKKHPDQELIIIKQKLFLLALLAIENQNLIKISWIKENVKTLGVHHGYNVDNDKILKDIIDRMKNCIQV
jgi:hypothetical protein